MYCLWTQYSPVVFSTVTDLEGKSVPFCHLHRLFCRIDRKRAGLWLIGIWSSAHGMRYRHNEHWKRRSFVRTGRPHRPVLKNSAPVFPNWELL